MNELTKKIPTIIVPSINNYHIDENNEKIISLSEAGLTCDSQYSRQGIPGSYSDCYARETVVRMLLEAQKNLPEGLKFKIFDGYRPICVQQRLWNFYRQEKKIKIHSYQMKNLILKHRFLFQSHLTMNQNHRYIIQEGLLI